MESTPWYFWLLAGFSLVLHSVYVYLPWGVQDIPNQRSMHSSPTRKSGGIVFVPLFLVCLYVWGKEGPFTDLALFLGAGVLFFALLGLMDDFYSLPALLRLGLEFLFVFLWLFFLFPKGHYVHLPFNLELVVNTWVLNFALTFLLVFGINLVNFMDGLDSYVSLNVFFSLLVFGFVFSKNFFFPEPLFWLIWMFLLSLTGFVFFNFPKAKLFMGDVGSLSLGFFWLCLPLLESQLSKTPLLIWNLFFLFPFFWLDGLTTLFHRLLQRKNVLNAHREHFYQLLTGTILGKKGSLVICLFANIPFWAFGYYFEFAFESVVLLFLVGFFLLYLLRILAFSGRKNLAE